MTNVSVIPSEVEESRCETLRIFAGSSTPLRSPQDDVML